MIERASMQHLSGRRSRRRRLPAAAQQALEDRLEELRTFDMHQPYPELRLAELEEDIYFFSDWQNELKSR
jgi:hypothetical protein